MNKILLVSLTRHHFDRKQKSVSSPLSTMLSATNFKYLLSFFSASICLCFCSGVKHFPPSLHLAHLPPTQWCLKCGFWNSSISLFWELVRNVNVWAHLPKIRTYWSGAQRFTSKPMHLMLIKVENKCSNISTPSSLPSQSTLQSIP